MHVRYVDLCKPASLIASVHQEHLPTEYDFVQINTIWYRVASRPFFVINTHNANPVRVEIKLLRIGSPPVER